MQVDVWVDVVCPWCFLGKRRFERALAGFEHRDGVTLVHHSFELDPRTPRGRVETQLEMLTAKYGMSEAQARAAQERIERLAAGEGIEMRLLGGLTGNTFDAHRLLHLAKERGREDALVERLYRAQFTEQRSLFDPASLTALATEAGLDPEEVGQVLESDRYADAVRADARKAQALGAGGVPFFVVDGRYGISGAQPAELFAQVLARAWADPAIRPSGAPAGPRDPT
jgi:predicted DsbA family dithiol-disulfide isomerase